MPSTTPPPKYVTIVHHVKEVSLYGRADLAYWRRYLDREGLVPFDDHGQAELVLIAADMVWMGARFTELSVSVAVQAGSTPARGGMYLIQAFNSNRAFAWAERVFFQTPYYHARTQVAAQPPLAFTLGHGQVEYLSAALAGPRPPASRGPGSLAGPVYLPSALTRTPRAEKLFHAELSGETSIYPFAAADTLRFAPASRAPIVQWLQDSGFAGTAWHIRPDATHKKSQTQPAPASAARLAVP